MHPFEQCHAEITPIPQTMRTTKNCVIPEPSRAARDVRIDRRRNRQLKEKKVNVGHRRFRHVFPLDLKITINSRLGSVIPRHKPCPLKRSRRASELLSNRKKKRPHYSSKSYAPPKTRLTLQRGDLFLNREKRPTRGHSKQNKHNQIPLLLLTATRISS